ncbi:MAG: hypothetical protein E7204_05015 [Veillonella sp.]|uniref:hypothetical protein n=1 Tax=Veillonella sp. TaxID=1926307 RepID=UPI0025F28CD6|nr:hypothetical protein [Veillonella sp.]MBE6080188.1 hypothetical protein [Veillonella sp.]
MKYKVLVGFSGVISAPLDAEIEIINQDWAEDLLNAGYIEPLETDAVIEPAEEEAVNEPIEEEPVDEPEEEPVKKTRRGRKASEG